MKHYWWNHLFTLLNLHRKHICISSWGNNHPTLLHTITETYKSKQIQTKTTCCSDRCP